MKKVLLALALALTTGLAAGCVSAEALEGESPFDDPVVSKWTRPQAAAYAPGTPGEESAPIVCHPGMLADTNGSGVTARVVQILDGDTVELTSRSGPNIRARLWGIDAPELTQRYGPKARTGLGILAPVGATVTYYPAGTDTYGRTLISLSFQGRAVNVVLVGNGLAYHVDAYESAGNQCLNLAQRIAQRRKYGVWENPEGQERPWDYRRRRQQGGAS